MSQLAGDRMELYLDGAIQASQSIDPLNSTVACQFLLGRLSTQPGGPVAVFTHGLFMRSVAWSLVSRVTEPSTSDMRDFRRFAAVYRTPNGGVVELRTRPGRPAPSLMGASTFHLPADPPRPEAPPWPALQAPGELPPDELAPG